jgi:hypothetical protein
VDREGALEKAVNKVLGALRHHLVHAGDGGGKRSVPGRAKGGGVNIAVVNPEMAKLTGQYGVVVLDADKDSLYNGIVFSIEVQINQAAASQITQEGLLFHQDLS